MRASCLLRFFIFLLFTTSVCASKDLAPTETASKPFVLLHSVLGYEAKGIKWALIRAVQPELNHAGAVDLDNSSAQVVSAGGITTGYPLQYSGKTFGNHWWQVDFSGLEMSGRDFRLFVTVKLAGKEEEVRLQSTPFSIQDDILFRSTFPGIALGNAEARKAPPGMGGGYFDSNTRMGEAYSHAMFASGLLSILERRGFALPLEVNQHLAGSAERALDYVVRLQERDGHILDQHPSRPFQGLNPGLVNTTLGVYGLLRGALILRGFDADKAQEYVKAAELGFGYLRFRKSDADMATLAALLYRASGRKGHLRDAAVYARVFPQPSGRSTAGERSLEALPYNEGLMDLVELAPDHPEWLRWIHRLLAHGVHLYQEIPRQNVFNITPWDNVGRAISDLVPFESCRTSHFSRVAYSSLRLAELFPSAAWEPTVTASLQWLAGLNHGFPGDRVIPASENPVEPASFVTNAGSRYVKQLTAELQWSSPTIVNGFTRGFRYENTWQAAETFILHDGLWMMALSRYGVPPRLTIQTTCAGTPCSTGYEINVGNEKARGSTGEVTGRAEIVLPAWGEASLELAGPGGQMQIPFYAPMGSHRTLRVDLETQLLVSAHFTEETQDSSHIFRLDVTNCGRRATRARVSLQADGAEIADLPVQSMVLKARETKSLLIEIVPTSATFVIAARVDWPYGSEQIAIFGTRDGDMYEYAVSQINP